jgi:hypothetical protein
MELSAHTRVSFPRELVFCTYRDNLPDTVPFLPNIASIVVKERKDAPPKTELINVWTGKTEIPSLARRFVKADMLMWTDYATWDEAAWSCHWRIQTHAFPGLMECRGCTEFAEDGAGTDIKVAGDLVLHLENAHIPRLLSGTVRPVIEKIIIAALKPNLLSTGEGVEKFLLSKR